MPVALFLTVYCAGKAIPTSSYTSKYNENLRLAQVVPVCVKKLENIMNSKT